MAISLQIQGPLNRSVVLVDTRDVPSIERSVLSVPLRADRDGDHLARWPLGRGHQALCRSLGYAATELIGDSVETFVHPSDLADASQTDRLLAGEISSGQVDQRFVRRDGTVVWLRVSRALVRGENGEADWFIAQCEDVTEAKAIEQELARERRWLVESQAAGRVGSWELDLETGEGRWSREQFNLYGVDPDGPVPGLDALLGLIHDEDRGAMLESLRHHMESGEDFIDEYRIRHPRLGVRALLVRGRYLPRDPDLGRPARMAGTTLDVTAERSVEAARQRDEDQPAAARDDRPAERRRDHRRAAPTA